MKKIVFTDKQISEIEKDYLINNLSCETIGKKFGISKVPINNLLKKNGKLKKGSSNGKKINLTDEQVKTIKKLYLEELRTGPYIAKILNLNKNLIDKILYNSNFRRSLGESISLRQTGKKRSERVIKILERAQQNYAKSGKRKQTGGICRKFLVKNISCQGTYEKYYIEKLIKEDKTLPNNSKPIDTPYGVYYPDFSFNNRLIEIKCDYTYDILIGKKQSRFTKKIDTRQYDKIKWVNKNVITVDILIVDKKNNKIIKKEIT
jgi:predicted DNA-binding protein YlxM (UPF0122 family)